MNKYIFNYQKLKGKIKEVFGSQEAYAVALGYTPETISNKLNNKAEFTQSDIVKSLELLKIDSSELYFFNLEVQNLEQKEVV